MRVGSLFSGIGGIDLGLERAGMTVAWQCEIDPYARKVLAKHWPDIPCYEDVRNLPDDIEPVDLICGGYPCQPFSLAGKRGGADDPRHLWPAFASTLRLLRPEWALLENVPGHLSMGFGDVLGDLAALGYDAEWTCIPAAAVGAPHLRWRVFIVAHARCLGGERRGGPGDLGSQKGTGEGQTPQRERVRDASDDCRAVLADAESISKREPTDEAFPLTGSGKARQESGGGGWWATEPNVGRVANGIPNRVDRLRALGNAVVPQVAELIGRRIMASSLTLAGEGEG